MRKILDHRPSPAMVVALIALVVAMSGSAVAATRLVRGDKLIRKGSLSGNRLRKHTLTGTQINLKRLGTVPKANYANSAGNSFSATNATDAVNATNADNANEAFNAAELGGAPASSYMTTASRIGTGGIVKVQGTASGTTVSLFKSGPFSVNMTCTRSGSDTTITLNAQSSEANASLNANSNVTANTTYDLGDDLGPTPSGESEFVPVNLEAPSGAQVEVTGAAGLNSLGGTGNCWATLIGIA